MIEGHGDDLYRYAGKVRVNFSSNIRSGHDHKGLREYLRSIDRLFGSYPEPSPYSLERRMAARLGVRSEEVIVTNGATEAIYLLAESQRGDVSAILAPTFREYGDACRRAAHTVENIFSIDRLRDFCRTYRPAMIWLCNPNNPTGEIYPREKILSLAEENPDSLMVLDQSYAPYALKPLISEREAVERGNIVILGSMTKRFGVPGLRVGHAVGASAILDAVRSLRMPWSVNSVAAAATGYLIDHESDYPIDAEKLHSEALRIGVGLRELGAEVFPTDCNFLLTRLPEGFTSAEMKARLIDEYGLLVRDASNFDGLTDRHIRIAAQDPEENDALLRAFESIIKKTI